MIYDVKILISLLYIVFIQYIECSDTTNTTLGKTLFVIFMWKTLA